MALIRILFFLACVLAYQDVASQTAKDSVIVLGSPEAASDDVFYRLQGHVQESSSGAPIVGASIFFGGVNKGTISDANGDFQISLKQGTYRLSIRHVAMETQRYTIRINAAGILDFKLVEKTATLEEVIVMAESEERNVQDPLGGISKLNISEV